MSAPGPQRVSQRPRPLVGRGFLRSRRVVSRLSALLLDDQPMQIRWDSSVGKYKWSVMVGSELHYGHEPSATLARQAIESHVLPDVPWEHPLSRQAPDQARPVLRLIRSERERANIELPMLACSRSQTRRSAA